MVQTSKKRIAFLCPYPYDTAPGQRFRYEQYFAVLQENGYEFLTLEFLDKNTNDVLYKRGHFIQKVRGILKGYFRRMFQLFRIISFDYVFIFREASPLGPPVFEWIIAKLLRKKIIYDFDDAIWVPSVSPENKIIEKFKSYSKVAHICQWAYKVSCGNKYLCDFALQHNKNVVYNPTTIDTINYHNRIKNQSTSKPIIGWTGTHSTIKYIDLIYPVLKRLDQHYDFTFEVIADKSVELSLKSFSFKQWSKKTEIEDLLNFNIGVMPLSDDEWSKGKCGFKALQYMSLGIPAVVSPVGVNSEIVKDSINGFLCDSEDTWFKSLSTLIEDVNKRTLMGLQAVKTVRDNYSVLSNTKNFLSLFD